MKKKTYHWISKKKYAIILLQKELEKLKNYIIVLFWKFDIYHFKSPTEDIDFNDAESLFDDRKGKQIRFEDVEKILIKFESKLTSVRIGGNKLNKQLSEIENFTKFYKSWKVFIKFYIDY